jgi:mutator protein MutT
MMNETIQWKYCPKCGGIGLALKDKRCLCGVCGLEFFFNIASAVAGIIEYEGRVILTRRGREPRMGMLDLPGGFVDYGETAEEGLVREVKEELNIPLSAMRYLISFPNKYLYNTIEYRVLDLFFVCQAERIDPIRPQDDVAEYLWVRREEIPVDQFAFESTRNGVAYYLKSLK